VSKVKSKKIISPKNTSENGVKSFTFPKLLFFFIALFLCAFIIFTSFNDYLNYQKKNIALQEEKDSTETQINSLQNELAKWNSEDYLISQAREHLASVKTGEVKISYDLDGESIEELAPHRVEQDEPLTDNLSNQQNWYDTLLDSFK